MSRFFKRSPLVLVLAAVALVALAACGSSSTSTPTATGTTAAATETSTAATTSTEGTATAGATGTSSAATVNVSLKEWSVTPQPTSVAAGEVRFNATNDGTTQHEMVVVKTDLAADQLPRLTEAKDDHAVGDVDEDALESPGEIEGIDPGTSQQVTFRLTPGHYVIFCNLPAHYGLGMHTELTVK